MADHDEHLDDAERRRRAVIEEFRNMRGRYAAEYEGPDPAGERSEAIRRLLTADDPYAGISGALDLERDLGRGSLDVAALARRRLKALRGVKEREFDNPLCNAAADLLLEAMASQLVLEAALAIEDRKAPPGADPGAVRDLLSAAVADLGDDDMFELLAMALRHSERCDWVAELRRDLGL